MIESLFIACDRVVIVEGRRNDDPERLRGGSQSSRRNASTLGERITKSVEYLAIVLLEFHDPQSQ